VITDRTLAVADGVGGWAENNIDPAIYARRLCQKYYKSWYLNSDIVLLNLLLKKMIDINSHPRNYWLMLVQKTMKLVVAHVVLLL
jgi:serine/threonine protein phosphatase PrpC